MPIPTTYDIVKSIDANGGYQDMAAIDLEKVKKDAQKAAQCLYIKPTFKLDKAYKTLYNIESLWVVAFSGARVPRKKDAIKTTHGRPVINFCELTEEEVLQCVRGCVFQDVDLGETDEEYEERILGMSKMITEHTRHLIQVLDALDKAGEEQMEKLAAIHPNELGFTVGTASKDKANKVAADKWNADKAGLNYRSIRRDGCEDQKGEYKEFDRPQYSIRFPVNGDTGHVLGKRWDDKAKVYVADKPIVFDGTVDDALNTRRPILIDDAYPINHELYNVITPGSIVRMKFTPGELRRIAATGVSDLNLTINEIFVMPNKLSGLSGDSAPVVTEVDTCMMSKRKQSMIAAGVDVPKAEPITIVKREEPEPTAAADEVDPAEAIPSEAGIPEAATEEEFKAAVAPVKRTIRPSRKTSAPTATVI